MSKETAYSILAIVLTALMMVSVFGTIVSFSGTAASAPTGSVAVAEVFDNPVEYDGTIEIALNDSTDNAVTAGDVMAWRNGTDVSGTVTVDPNGNGNDGTNGVLEISVNAGTDISPTEKVIVNVTTLANAENHTVTLTGADASAGNPLTGTDAVYQGTDVAIVAGATGSTIDIKRNGNRVRTRGTGTNSAVYVFDSSDADPGDTRYFDVRNSQTNISVEVRDLGLTASASSTSLTAGDTLTVTASANVVNREVLFELKDADGNVVETTTATLDSNGEATYENSSMVAGEYTVSVTDENSGTEAETDTILVGSESGDFLYTLREDTTYAIGFPGPINGTYGDVFGHFNGTIWAYDAEDETWRHPDAKETIDPLDAVYVVTEEEATIAIDFADSDSGPGAPGEKRVYAGWNFIGAPQYSGAESAFAATTAEPKRILQVANEPANQPFPAGDRFGWYAFGQGPSGPRVSAFTGYWVFMAENGTVGANLYRGVTKEEAVELLTNGST